jgi:hypothetical protein
LLDPSAPSLMALSPPDTICECPTACLQPALAAAELFTINAAVPQCTQAYTGCPTARSSKPA